MVTTIIYIYEHDFRVLFAGGEGGKEYLGRSQEETYARDRASFGIHLRGHESRRSLIVVRIPNTKKVYSSAGRSQSLLYSYIFLLISILVLSARPEMCTGVSPTRTEKCSALSGYFI